jgi:signal transduction histidine kinase
MSSFSPLNLVTRRAVKKAVLDERGRIARDLHDGLAQELAFISMHSRRLVEHGAAKVIEDLAAAAERALYEARTVIEVMLRPPDQPLHVAVSLIAEQLTHRSEARLELDVDPRVKLAPEQRDDLLCIVREAVWNGLQHGKASAITVRLSQGAGLQLCVADNGIGFDPGALPHGASFGLRTMTERARALGGEARVRSRPGGGTEVEVILP